jgi:NAD(P)-dependent dehydrogenase (short-subunit alcohol dehydrogenase family)/acyl carrier protein
MDTPSPNQMNLPKNEALKSAMYVEKKNIMKKEQRPDNTPISDALKTIQDGLKSMQMLQIKTAETHQQFLRAQAAASRTLQSMMERTQRLTEASLGISSVPQNLAETLPDQPPVYPEIEKDFKKERNDSSGLATPPQDESSLNTVSQNPVLDVDSTSKTPDGPERHQHLEPTGSGRHELQNTLLDVVSQLTGYPAEMLGLDMDMESDLGIDSIKRVEIFSTLEEKLPNLPAMSPDILGGLKTLAQIIDYISDPSKTARPDPAKVASATAQKPAADEMIRTTPFDNHRQELLNSLLATVHQLTGYPVEMLGLDMDIEADLGIDSIKRVEILSSLEEKIPNLPTLSPDLLGSLKTLGHIVDHLAGHVLTDSKLTVETHSPQTRPDTSLYREELTDQKQSESGLISDRVKRYVVSAAPRTEPKAPGIQIPSGSKVLVTDDEKGLSQALVEEFKRRNIDSSLIPPDSIPQNQNSHTAGGLVLVPNSNSSFRSSDLKNAFALTQHIAPQLLESAEKESAIFASITRLDGAFGFNGAGLRNPLQGALAGLVKTAAIEWQAVSCHAIDIAPDWRPYRKIAGAIVDVLLTSEATVEIGMDQDKRVVPELVAAPFAGNQNIRIDLDPNDVVVVAGGARGITAAATSSLANITGATFVLLGRSPRPTAEPAWLKGLTHQTDMKKAILENQFKDRKASPALLEKAYKKLCAQREISATVDQLRSTGATVSYHSVDVRDAQAVKSLLDGVRKEHGAIKAVIHGAGVLEDRLILDKTVQQFEKVFDTKVRGLSSLLEATRPDALKYLVLFSSITARIGNRGQVDYAMANEAINKIAQHESKERPQCKVISINWGPWTGGMVTPALQNEFERNGIQLISPDDGAKCLLYEMSQEKSGPVEVVLGSNTMTARFARPTPHSAGAHTPSQPQKEEEEFLITFKREIDVDRYPILGSHVIGGKPVVPLALMTEWFAHSALHNNPGLFLCGFDDMRILQGVRIEQEKRIVRLMAAKARKKRSAWEVAVELRDGFKNGIEVIHSRAKAVMSETLSPPPTYRVPVELKANHYPRSVEEVYTKILFHGTDLHGIKKIVSLTERGMMASIGSAPSPSAWMKQPLRNHWIGDPLVLDSAFQMATVWCYENMGVVSLPSYIGSYRQYRSKFPAEGVTAVLEVQASSEHKMTGDITFLDRNSMVVARITGYQAIADQSLFKAFKGQISD